MTSIKDRPSYLLFAIRAFGLIVTSVTLALVYAILRLLLPGLQAKHNMHYRMMRLWGKSCSLICGYQIKIQGSIPKGETFLFACNHMSYADIIALAGVLPTYFVSKAEVKGWPLIGQLACVVQTIMISRKRDKALAQIHDKIKARLESKGNVLVFLEGQSTDGRSVQPFHSPLLQAPIDANTRIVPISLDWSTTNPNLNLLEDIAYWRDDHHLLQHMVRHLGKNGKHLAVNIGEPISLLQENRKSLAKKAHLAVVELRTK